MEGYIQIVESLRRTTANRMIVSFVVLLAAATVIAAAVLLIKRKSAWMPAVVRIRMAAFFLTGMVFLFFSASFFADAAKNLYRLGLDAKENTARCYEGELTARKAHFLFKGTSLYRLDDLWLGECSYTPETEWMVGETYAVEYLAHTGYIVDSAFILNPSRLIGHALSSEERRLFPAIDLPEGASLAAVKSGVYRMVSEYWRREGAAYGYDSKNTACSIAAFYSKQTDQYLCRLYWPDGDFACYLVLEARTGQTTHFWIEV